MTELSIPNGSPAPTARWRRLATIALVVLLTPAVAPAQRTFIEVGSPNFRPLPVAVAPFQTVGGSQAEAAELNKVIRNDLLLSGLFEVLDPKSFLADPREGVTVPTIKFSRWSDIGAEGLVKAAVRKGPADISVDWHLFEVRAGREVLGPAYRGPPEALRHIAHRFADDVVKHYTREPGPFRTRIALLRKSKGGARELVTYDVDGHRPHVIYKESGIVMLPSWRPDGKAILFTSYRSGRPHLWTVDVTTGNAKRLVAVGDLTTGGVYSQDGKQIAFTASQGGNSDVWVANADGSRPRRLTTDPSIDGSPSWSPDGKRICFVSNRSGNPHLYLMNSDGSDQRRLTFQGNYNQTPRWSPRGDLIAFTARDERRVFDVFTVSPTSGVIQRVTQDQGRTNEEPTWAPNGRLLAFSSDRNGQTQLVVSTVNGERQMVVVRESSGINTPAWGPFARQ